MTTTTAKGPTARPRWLVALAVAFVLLSAGSGALQLLSHVITGTVQRAAAFEAPADRLVIRSGAGDLRLVPSPDGQVHVRTSASYGLVEPELRVASSPAGLTLDGRCSGPLAGQCEIDHEVAVPAALAVTVEPGCCEVVARDLTGPLTVRRGSDDVELFDLAGPIEVSTTSGEVVGSGLQSGAVRAESGSGDVTLELLDPRAVQVRAGSGEVGLTVPGSLRYRVEVRTGSGEQEIAVPTDVGADRSVVVAGDSGDVWLLPAD